MRELSVLIPTYNRNEALAVTLTSLAFQEYKDFDIIIADQSTDENLLKSDVSLQTVISLLNTRGHKVTIYRNMPFRGMAQQRQFLLEKTATPYCLYLDDDLILESYSVRIMIETIKKEKCGFVGCAVIGLSYIQDIRPHQQHVEFWDNQVEPELVLPKTEKWERYKLHNAANLWHVQQKYCITHLNPRTYKVAWVGGCALYDTQKLNDVGGFTFWEQLPEKHCGEDVLAQLRVMEQFGGCGVMPSGVYHQELKTTIPERDFNAPEYLFKVMSNV